MVDENLVVFWSDFEAEEILDAYLLGVYGLVVALWNNYLDTESSDELQVLHPRPPRRSTMVRAELTIERFWGLAQQGTEDFVRLATNCLGTWKLLATFLCHKMAFIRNLYYLRV